MVGKDVVYRRTISEAWGEESFCKKREVVSTVKYIDIGGEGLKKSSWVRSLNDHGDFQGSSFSRMVRGKVTSLRKW